MDTSSVYRMLVVDDEALIADSLANMLQCSLDDRLDVYKAYSGPGALALLERTSFDIMVLDIQMPGMSGLELAKAVRGRWPSCKVVFLSGHDAFEYVYQAMQYQAVCYVLKNEGDEALLEAVRRCVGALDEEARSDALLERAQEQMRMCLPILRREFLQRCCRGDAVDEAERARQFARYEVSLDPDAPVMLLAGRGDEAHARENATQVDIVVRDKLQHAARCEMAQAHTRLWVWLIQPFPGEPASRAAVMVKGMAENIQRTCLSTLGTPVSFVFETQPCAWHMLRDACATLRLALETLANERSGGLAFAEAEFFRAGEAECRADEEREVFVRLRGLLSDISWRMSGGDAERFEACAAELTALLTPYVHINNLSVAELFSRMDTLLLTFAVQHDLQERARTHPAFRALTSGGAVDPEARLGRFVSLGRCLMGWWHESRRDKRDAFVCGVDDYIANHLAEDLSLVTLSERVFLNPSYLSRRYKELTGKNITDVIAAARMDRAALLLADPRFRIRGIAEQVGFASPAHFSRVFKKHTSQTPQAYRDRVRSAVRSAPAQ